MFHWTCRHTGRCWVHSAAPYLLHCSLAGLLGERIFELGATIERREGVASAQIPDSYTDFAVPPQRQLPRHRTVLPEAERQAPPLAFAAGALT